MPGGRSTVGRTFADAGADYVFSDLKNSGSSPLSFETVYEKAKDADIWLIKYNMPEDKTYRDLKTIMRHTPDSGLSVNGGCTAAIPGGCLTMKKRLSIPNGCWKI